MGEERLSLLLAYSAGRLEGEKAVTLESHMSQCTECAELGRTQTAVWKMLEGWEAAPVSTDFNRRLYAKIDALDTAPWPTRITARIRDFLNPVFARPAFAAAAASLVILAGFVLDHPTRGLKPIGPQASIHSVSVEINKAEADQVEATLDDVEMLRQFDSKSDDSKKGGASKSM